MADLLLQSYIDCNLPQRKFATQNVVENSGEKGDQTSPEDETASSASLLLSPRVDAHPTPLSASTPLQHTQNGPPNGHARDSIDGTTVNGNGNLVSESTHSIDVLSGGESDAYDTLSRTQTNNNSISSKRADTLKARRRGDFAHSVAKQLLMNERTHKRDLQLVTVTWSVSVSRLVSCGAEVVEALGRPCLALEPLALAQGAFLARLERCLAACSPARISETEEPEYKRIAEILYDYLSNTCDAYLSYISRAAALIARLESARRGEVPAAGEACAAFDASSPLPLACLLLRPLHAPFHYRSLATELSQEPEGTAYARKLQDVTSRLTSAAIEQLRHAENHTTLCQLQRDIIGYDKILIADREFLRLGCVYKHSTKGIQQRMLFLFSDVLVCASKASGGAQFRAHYALPLHHLRLEPSDLPHSFTLTDGADLSLVLSASNEQEFLEWRLTLNRAIEAQRAAPCDVDTQLTPYEQDVVSTSSSCNNVSGAGGGALAQVCWHRAASLSRDHLHLAMQTQLSGYLLRKFKNSHGWQKLWVVFAMFSLFFYKSWQDDAPLASLPLLGYTVGPPSESDAIHKEYVFKLQFKSHVYFFRADSHYTYERWTEALEAAMVHHTRY